MLEAEIGYLLGIAIVNIDLLFDLFGERIDLDPRRYGRANTSFARTWMG